MARLGRATGTEHLPKPARKEPNVPKITSKELIFYCPNIYTVPSNNPQGSELVQQAHVFESALPDGHLNISPKHFCLAVPMHFNPP